MPLNPAIARLIRVAYKKDFANLHTFPVERIRDYLSHPIIRTPLASYIDIPIKPEVSLRCFTPKASASSQSVPAIFFIPASAFIIDRTEASNYYCSLIANQTNMKVINIAHRLAPEHKFPKCLYDCVDSIKWLQQNALQYQVDPDKLAIWGESSGGTIAASCTHVLKSESLPILKHQTLFYPMLDLVNNFPSKKSYGQGYMLDNTFIKWLVERGFHPNQDRTNPLASPLLSSNFCHLPPTTIITAEYDPLRDEGELYSQKLKQAKVPTYHKRFNGMIHSFMRFYNNIEEPKTAMIQACNEIKSCLNYM